MSLQFRETGLVPEQAERGRGMNSYRVVQKKGTVLLGTSLAWPAVAGCSRAETFSQLSAISFAQPCISINVRF